jgi:hypothetical protein
MPHRSDQAVASQEQAASQPPEDSPPARRIIIGWTTALAALGLSTAGVLGVLWLVRMPIASFFIGAALADRGAEADFEIVNLDFSHFVMADLRFGSESSPDVAAPRVEARWTWDGLTPRLAAVRIVDPMVRLQVTDEGRVSAGSLDRLGAGPPGRRRASIPSIELEIVNGVAEIAAPFGTLSATFQGSGRLGEDFRATARIEETSKSEGAHSLDRGRADLVIASREGVLAAQLNADAASLRWGNTTFAQAAVRITARAPLNLSRYEGEAAWRVASLEAPSISARQLSGGLGGEAATNESNAEPRVWQGQARINAASLRLRGNAVEMLRFDARLEGDADNGGARWTLTGQNFDGLSMLAPQLTASGDLRFAMNGATTGAAHATLTQARLDGEAQDTLRDAFPNLADTPIGPTFAAAEGALVSAAQRFDVTVPLDLSIDGAGTRVTVSAPVEARAATGAVLRLEPLRTDSPTLVMQWPGAALHGAAALNLSGGGTPRTALLLDSVDWAPGAPFEADGTLTLADWRADNASIATNELAVALSVAPDGAGRLELRGPANITGPVGDGEVRNMVAALDLAVLWSRGWQVVPNGCVPIRMGGLDAAGLSFSDGAFSLCPTGDALIAADAGRNLSGGFSIRSLALNGRMAGPEAQPAQLAADSLTGQFRGVTDNITLALRAARPCLSIEMGDERRLALALQSATANARIGGGTWSIEGDFQQGTLNDRSLPGVVTTIAGQWRAAPRESGGGPIIQVTSGEALLTAHTPDSLEERPLFNPMRLANVEAVLSDGEINANGAIVLDANEHQLAAFTAFHDISGGAGSTRISAASVTFDETLQPYNITERARGMVENVRGAASVVADVTWTRESLTATGAISTTGVSFATATMPVVQDVRGAIYFDDLFNLTTPPGQNATIGLINPGLAARNGQVRFQLLPDQQVSVEQAEFEFAGGVLAMAPTIVRLGEDETRIQLTLRDVDAADLIANLNVPDLAATGRVEGSFPLRLTRQTAFIEGGVLRSQGEGGILSYTGNAGENVEGFSRVAFDALRRFSYDNLTLTLDGDLNGEVISSIEFSGRNSGRPVELGDMTSIPGVGSVQVRGVPFDFNVRISAPFRSLARTASTITDPGSLIDRATGEDVNTETDIRLAPPAEQPETVDPSAPATR